jgi:CHC2 zinc finger/Toprim-like
MGIDFDQIRQSDPLLQYCQKRGIELHGSGASGEWVGLCPLHSEKTPSFHVYPDNHYHCYGCGAHGDVTSLEKEIGGGTIAQAAERLGAQRTLGIGLRSDSPQQLSGQIKLPSALVMKPPWTGLPYLMSPEESKRCCATAKALNESPEHIARICEWRDLKPETIRSLILDPAIGVEGNNVAFPCETGMKLRPIGGSSDQSWWAFGKPFVWRGWPLVDASIRHCVSTVHIAEGEFDAARLLELGFESDDLSAIVTAIPGANCFKSEWVTLFRGKKVFLWLDNDRAGKQATKRIGALLFQAGVKVKVVNLTRVKGGA